MSCCPPFHLHGILLNLFTLGEWNPSYFLIRHITTLSPTRWKSRIKHTPVAANHTQNWNGLRSWNYAVADAKITVHPGRESVCGAAGGHRGPAPSAHEGTPTHPQKTGFWFSQMTDGQRYFLSLSEHTHTSWEILVHKLSCSNGNNLVANLHFPWACIVILLMQKATYSYWTKNLHLYAYVIYFHLITMSYRIYN